MQAVADAHETATSEPVVRDGAVVSGFQEAPFQDSATGVLPWSAPTARQYVAEVHETPDR